MADYDLEIGGEHSLESINQQITGEEAGASEFVRNSVVASPTAASNSATFKELNPGTVPKALTLLFVGTATPPNSKRIWSGQMVVSGTNRSVEAYRIN